MAILPSATSSRWSMTSNSDRTARPVAPLEWYRRFAPKTVLAVLGAVAVCNLGFYLLAVRPAKLGEHELEARNAALAAQVQNSRASTEVVQARAKLIETAEADGSALIEEIALPRQSAFSALLTELGAAATQAGIEIRETSYAVEPLEGNEQYGSLAVNASLRGRYDNLVQFLYQLDRSKVFFVIDSLGATPRSDGNMNELQINMRFDTLVRGL
ncbi:MAG: type 4a pilus biogenesis protein PilO [Acidobacteriia bacterium]|nr:type 4a pilus biogenesis protein PilO [Terriglobia bacterium]MYC65760.1 type 4a pilus biogenesis protein PilO [Terriglobia bacterium]